MQYVNFSFLAVLATVLVAACVGREHPQMTNVDPGLERRLAHLESQLQTLESKINKVELADNLARKQFLTGVFDPASSTFQRIDSKNGIGSFAVSVQDVRQFGDGVRVTLNFGNPSMVAYSDIKVGLRYGPRMPSFDDPKFSDSIGQWDNSLKTKEETILARLEPGRWNPRPVTLPEIKVDQFGYLEVTLETSTIFLH